MNAKQLDRYPKLKKVLAPTLRNKIRHINDKINSSHSNYILNYYSLFIAITEKKPNYSALNIFNCEKEFNQQLQSLIGFIYSDVVELSDNAKYNVSRYFKKIFTTLAIQNQFTVTPIKISVRKLTNDIIKCQQQFNTLTINRETLNYYQSWVCESKEGYSHYLHLAPFRDAFGETMTNTVHQTICNFTRTQKKTTTNNIINHLISLLNYLPHHCATEEELRQRLQPYCSVKLMEEIMLLYLFEEQIKGNIIKTSIKRWKNMIKYFIECFIDSGVFEAPIISFIYPDWKEPKIDQYSISVGGALYKSEKERWLVNIPLTIKDDQALDIIHQRLNKDLEHIKIVSEQIVASVTLRHQRNLNYIESGTVKPLSIKSKYPTGFPIGHNHIANTVATYYHYGCKSTQSHYAKFLGYSGNMPALTKELNLPTLETLNAFITLLVLAHPKITPSWLEEWELFDKNGNQVGFFQSGNQWFIKSYKNRRGTTLAQQVVILTPYSKSLVETLIEHTAFARTALQKQGDSRHRFIILALPSADQKPTRYSYLNGRLNDDRRFHQQLAVASSELEQKEAEQLSRIVTPRAIRKSRALQIYLETRSLRAVSEALGHANINSGLLGKYLPTPLMDFFQARWVRQFQNAIIYEALKGSPYLFDALDFDKDKLTAFLKNHGLGKLPDQLTKVKVGGWESQEDQQDLLDELVFMISTPLFQVLIALQQVMNHATEKETFSPIIETWFEVAEFILSHFSTTIGKGTYNSDKHCETLYQKALANPLPLDKFKEGLCQ